MWHHKYMMRVTGLGAVEALFLPVAADDAEARAHARIGLQSDRRKKIVSLYRIEALDIEGQNLSGTAFASVYLETGIPDKKSGNIVNNFFEADSDAHARTVARKRDWHENALYRCEEIALE
jgi:hypothetical protein